MDWLIKRIGHGRPDPVCHLDHLIFVGVEALPGDLAEEILGQNALPETVAQFRKELKLDEPPVKRYFLWLGAFLRGDLGNSLANKRPVSELIFWRFKNTIFSGGLSSRGCGAALDSPGDTGGALP